MRFAALALGDVVEQDGYLVALCGAGRKSEHIVPDIAHQVRGFLFKVDWLPAFGDSAVDSEPLFFMGGRQCAHGFAHGVLQSDLFLKRGVSFQESVVGWLAVHIEDDLHDAEALFHVIEEHQVFIVCARGARIGQMQNFLFSRLALGPRGVSVIHLCALCELDETIPQGCGKSSLM
ncbi:MAG: hypothetical protein R3C14_52555 [Caldilineaceae bacterium]